MENTFMIFDSIKNEVKANNLTRERALNMFEYLVGQYTEKGMNHGKKLGNGFIEPRFQIMKRATPDELFDF